MIFMDLIAWNEANLLAQCGNHCMERLNNGTVFNRNLISYTSAEDDHQRQNTQRDAFPFQENNRLSTI